MKTTIGILRIADRRNFLPRCLVSFFLFSISLDAWFVSMMLHEYQAFSTALSSSSFVAVIGSILTIACSEEKFTLACNTPGVFLSDFSINNAQLLQCMPSISIDTILLFVSFDCSTGVSVHDDISIHGVIWCHLCISSCVLFVCDDFSMTA